MARTQQMYILCIQRQPHCLSYQVVLLIRHCVNTSDQIVHHIQADVKKGAHLAATYQLTTASMSTDMLCVVQAAGAGHNCTVDSEHSH